MSESIFNTTPDINLAYIALYMLDRVVVCNARIRLCIVFQSYGKPDIHPRKLDMVYVPCGPLPSAINEREVFARAASTGTLVPFTARSFVVSMLLTT